MDNIESPCATCEHRHQSRTKKPCNNCDLPAQYDDALKETFFPIVKFLRDSTPRKAEPKKEMKKMEQLEVSLKTYCDQEGVSVVDVISKSKDPKIAEVRKNIARKMAGTEGLDYKIIAAKLKMSPSAVWNYLNTVSDKKPVKNCLVLDFSNYPEVYDDILNLAEEELREPEKQAVWIFKKIHKAGMKEFSEKL